MTTTKRITTAAILKAIGCKHLSLYKGNGYFYFSYSDESKNLYETESVVVCALNHLQFDQWVAEGLALVKKMEPAPRQPGFDMIEKLQARRESLSREPNGCWLHKHEMQELWDLEDSIRRGMESERRAQFYLDTHSKGGDFDRSKFPHAFFAEDKANGFEG